MLLMFLALALVAVALTIPIVIRAVGQSGRRRRARRLRQGLEVRDPGRERRAEQRARELMRSCVNEEEWAMYRDLGFLRVYGRTAGRAPSLEDLPLRGGSGSPPGPAGTLGDVTGRTDGTGRADGTGRIDDTGRIDGTGRIDDTGRADDTGHRHGSRRTEGTPRADAGGPPRPEHRGERAYAYLIYPHKPIVAYVCSSRRLLSEYCVEFPDLSGAVTGSRLPDSDDVLAKWMALTGDERRLIRNANMHLPGRQLDPARVRRDLWRLSEWERQRRRSDSARPLGA